MRHDTPPALSLLVITDARTSLGHLVTADAMTIGRRLGRYVTCCGIEVLPSSLLAEESGLCRRCSRWMAGQ